MGWLRPGQRERGMGLDGPGRLKRVFVAVTLLLVAIAAYASVLIVQQQNALRDATRYNVTWMVSQAALEVARLTAVVGAYAAGSADVNRDEVRLRLDIVFNQVGLLGTGEVGRFVHSDPELAKLAAELQQRITEAEPLVDGIDQPGAVARLVTLLLPLNVKLPTLAAQAYVRNSGLVGEDMNRLNNVHWVLSSVLVGLIVCSFGLIAVLAWNNKLLQRAHAEVQDLVVDLRRTGEELVAAKARVQRGLEELQARTGELVRAHQIARLGAWRWVPGDAAITWSEELVPVFGVGAAAFGRAAGEGAGSVHPDDRARLAADLERALARREPLELEFRIAAAGARWRHCWAEGQCEVDAHGQPVALAGICQDITERKEAEATLVRNEKLNSIGQLTGGIAHDFNNLLTVIAINLEMVEDALPKDHPVKEFVAPALQAVASGADLTGRLLSFARRVPLRPEITDLNAFLLPMRDLARRTLGERYPIEMDLAADLGHASVDQAQLEAALLNLIINARDAMPGGGRLTLQTANVRIDSPTPGDDAAPGDYVMVAVNDIGMGVPPEIRDRVFEPFFTTKAVGKGTGLGLSMVIGFTKQSGGFVRLESEPGEGTSVQIYLPRAGAEGGQEGAAATMNDWLPGPCRALIVEDRPDVLAAVCRISDEIGLLPTPARNAEEALAVLRGGARFELLFTDIVLGGAMDGLDLAEEAKRMMPELQVLLTTGYSEAVLKHGKRVEGAVVLAKPYTKAQFLAALRRLLGEKAEGGCPAQAADRAGTAGA